MNRGLFRMKLDLSRMEKALDAWKGVSLPVVQVVGTNGKGSVAAFLERIAREHGLKTGLFTSPHFITPRERIRIQGEICSRQKWLTWANQLADRTGLENLTYFELLTMLALVAFTMEEVDLAVFEAGLGGRYDATSALSRDLTMYTPIALDHGDVLGHSIDAVARDKAHAMREGVPALTGDQGPEVLSILERHAQKANTFLFRAEEFYSFHGDDILGATSREPDIGHPAFRTRGGYQRRNGLLALAGWTWEARQNGWPVSPEDCRRGLESMTIPGRFQLIQGTRNVLLDCAHNPAAMRALCEAIGQSGLRPSAVVFTCLKDKELEGMIPPLHSIHPKRIIVPELPGIERARNVMEIVRRLGPRAAPAKNLLEALQMVQGEGTLLVCGSSYLIAEYFRLFPEHLFGSSMHPGPPSGENI